MSTATASPASTDLSFRPGRRAVMAGAAATAAATRFATFASKPAAAAGSGQVVSVFLRGGQDHLSTVVPYTDAAYYDRRPTIAIPADEVLALDGQFGLHPAMFGLKQLFDDGRLSVVVGAGNPAGNRSHFVAQDLAELGATDYPGDAQGWLGRYLNQPSASESLFRGFTTGNNVNMSLRGFPALGIPSIAGFGLGGQSGFNQDFGLLVRSLYAGFNPIEVTGTQALDAAAKVADLNASTAADDVARGFEDIATLLDAGVGVEVATHNIGAWDTHDAMGTSSNGEMRDLLSGLDTHLTQFQSDLDSRGLNSVTTVVMTEFGRRVDENGSGGTDHGLGFVMLVMGGRANGGVFGTLPSLTPANTGRRADVPVTVDFRNVLGDVAKDVLGVTNPGALFPGHSYQRVGVTS